jgi:hypothetical protein
MLCVSCPAAGDWLQGPYVYHLYEHYGFSVRDIGRLFIMGFGSSAVFGTLAGAMADYRLAPAAQDISSVHNTHSGESTFQSSMQATASAAAYRSAACHDITPATAAPCVCAPCNPTHPASELNAATAPCLSAAQGPQASSAAVRCHLQPVLRHKAQLRLLGPYVWPAPRRHRNIPPVLRF